MNRTKNELADYAWNPVTGCLKDCRYCYAKKSALRFASDWRRNLAERPKVQQVGANLFELDAPWETTNNRFLNNPTGFMPTIRRHPECGRLYCIHVQLGRRTFRTQQPEKVRQRLPAALVQFGAAGCTGNRQGRYLRGEYRKNSQGVPECSRSDS